MTPFWTRYTLELAWVVNCVPVIVIWPFRIGEAEWVDKTVIWGVTELS